MMEAVSRNFVGDELSAATGGSAATTEAAKSVKSNGVAKSTDMELRQALNSRRLSRKEKAKVKAELERREEALAQPSTAVRMPNS